MQALLEKNSIDVMIEKYCLELPGKMICQFAQRQRRRQASMHHWKVTKPGARSCNNKVQPDDHIGPEASPSAVLGLFPLHSNSRSTPALRAKPSEHTEGPATTTLDWTSRGLLRSFTKPAKVCKKLQDLAGLNTQSRPKASVRPRWPRGTSGGCTVAGLGDAKASRGCETLLALSPRPVEETSLRGSPKASRMPAQFATPRWFQGSPQGSRGSRISWAARRHHSQRRLQDLAGLEAAKPAEVVRPCWS